MATISLGDKRSALMLVELLALIAIIGLLIARLFPGIEIAHAANPCPLWLLFRYRRLATATDQQMSLPFVPGPASSPSQQLVGTALILETPIYRPFDNLRAAVVKKSAL